MMVVLLLLVLVVMLSFMGSYINLHSVIKSFSKLT
jgi:hypothetical protein